MNVTLKITDPKKVIKLYPKFIQENKKFVQKLETNLNKSIKQLNTQLYHISFSPLTFDVTVKNTLKYTTNDTNNQVLNFIAYLSDKKLLKSTTVCNTLSATCTSTYDDINTTYNNKEISISGVTSDTIFKKNKEIISSMRVSNISVINQTNNTKMQLTGINTDIIYDNHKKFYIKYTINTQDIKLYTKDDKVIEFKQPKISFEYQEDKKVLFGLGMKKLNLPASKVYMNLEDFDFNINISDNTSYNLNIGKLDIQDKIQSYNLSINKFNMDYKYLDNNIFVCTGKTTINTLKFANSNNQQINFNIHKLSFVDTPSIRDDKLHLESHYNIEALSAKTVLNNFSLKKFNFDMTIDDIGYQAIKEYSDKLISIYKQSFIAGFNGDTNALNNINTDIQNMTKNFAIRAISILQYGIKADIKNLSIGSLYLHNQESKDIHANLQLSIVPITLKDISDRKYNIQNPPIESLKGFVHIPNTLVEMTNIQTENLPFKLIENNNSKEINIDYKNKSIIINGEKLQ